tara:strand:- start:12 stop:386 length:375 start_codon:yes stop_codon:yes gene_type:complete
MVTHLFTFHFQVRHYWITVEILEAKDDVAIAAQAEPVYISVTDSPAASNTIVVPEPTVAAGVIVILLPAVVQIIVLIWPVTPAASDSPVAPPDESTNETAVETEAAEEELVKLSVLFVAIKVGM